MVKKKVVRKHSSKTLPKGKKNDVRPVVKKPKHNHNVLIRSLAMAKAKHNLSKVEKLELAANIAVKDPKVVTPEKTEAKAEEQKTVEQKRVETIPDSAIIQPDPIYSDDVQLDIPAVKDEEHTSTGMRITVLIVTSIILIFWIILISFSIVTNVDRTVERNTTVTITEPIDLNLEKYVKANGTTSITDNSVIGYLREELVMSGAVDKTVYYMVDDYDNKVKLMLDYPETRTYDLIFLTGITSEKTYNVTGTFKYIQYEYVLDVDNITQQERPTHEVEIGKLENVTITGKGFRIDIPTGWKRLTEKE
jgi:hypothetical protein